MTRTITILLSLVVLSCATPMGMTSSTTPLQGKTITENLGKVEGTDVTWTIFSLPLPPIYLGSPDLDAAIKAALAEKGGDALINVRWYEKTYNFLLFGRRVAVVQGEAVKFAGTEEVKKK